MHHIFPPLIFTTFKWWILAMFNSPYISMSNGDITWTPNNLTTDRKIIWSLPTPHHLINYYRLQRQRSLDQLLSCPKQSKLTSTPMPLWPRMWPLLQSRLLTVDICRRTTAMEVDGDVLRMCSSSMEGLQMSFKAQSVGTLAPGRLYMKWRLTSIG